MKKFLFQMVTVPVMFGVLTGLYVQAASASEAKPSVETVCIKVMSQEVQKNGSSVIRIQTMCEKGR